MTDLVVIVNRRPGQCLGCRQQVPPDQGFAVKSGSSVMRWSGCAAALDRSTSR